MLSPPCVPGKMVGLVRFELTTSCTPCKRATRLRYSPKSFGMTKKPYRAGRGKPFQRIFLPWRRRSPPGRWLTGEAGHAKTCPPWSWRRRKPPAPTRCQSYFRRPTRCAVFLATSSRLIFIARWRKTREPRDHGDGPRGCTANVRVWSPSSQIRTLFVQSRGLFPH